MVENFGVKIKEARKSKGLTQEKLAKKVGVSSRTIQFYEAGEITPTIYIAKKIIDELDMDKEVDLSTVSTENLLAELKRRIGGCYGRF